MQGSSGGRSTSNSNTACSLPMVSFYCCYVSQCGSLQSVLPIPVHITYIQSSAHKIQIYERYNRNIVICESNKCSEGNTIENWQILWFYAHKNFVLYVWVFLLFFFHVLKLSHSEAAIFYDFIIIIIFAPSNIWYSVAFPKKKSRKSTKKKKIKTMYRNEKKKQKREAKIKISAASEKQTQ